MLSAFMKVLLYPIPFAPKLQEDLSTKRKSIVDSALLLRIYLGVTHPRVNAREPLL